MKIRTKMIMVFITILLLNSITSGILYYNYVAKDTLANYEDSAGDIAGQINLHLDNQVYSVLERIYAMCNNNGFNLSLSAYMNNPSSTSYPIIMGQVADTLTEVQNGERYIDSLFIYSRFGSFDTFTKSRNHSFSFEDSYLYQPFLEDKERVIHWFPSKKSEIFIDDKQVIPVVYKTHITGSREDMYVVINFSEEYFRTYLNANYTSFDYLYLMAPDGSMITESPAKLREETHKITDRLKEDTPMVIQEEISYDGQTYLGTFSKMPTSRWIICALKSETSLLKNLSISRDFIITMLAVTGIISMILAVLMSYSITHPLRKLVDAMEQVKKGDFQVRYTYKEKNEVGQLTDAFNRMVAELNHLIERLNIHIKALEDEKEKVKQIQEQKRLAELKALQAQINPHFLYNTLNTITWEAASAGITQVSQMSNALGRFFRIGLSSGKEIISFAEELEHASSYLEIQKIRYETKLHYNIYVEPYLYQISIIKLVLQPLIENAIYHGIKEKADGGTITISARKGHDMFGAAVLIAEVEDDGMGIPKSKLEEINETLIQGGVTSELGYGIYNVNERIRLYFGEEYGLSLSSEEGHWTKSTLVIPIIEVNNT